MLIYCRLRNRRWWCSGGR